MMKQRVMISVHKINHWFDYGFQKIIKYEPQIQAQDRVFLEEVET